MRWPIAFALAYLYLAIPSPVIADDQVRLVDNTKIVGEVLHYYDGMLTLRLPNGSKMKLPQRKIKGITFKLPKPRAALSTPRKTFNRMRKAALRGDVATYIDSHSAYYQMYLSHRASMTSMKKFRRQLKKEWGEAQLVVVSTKVDGRMATMHVRRRTKGHDAQQGEFRFVKENNEWKMILPL